jgi:hypothetical protein
MNYPLVPIMPGLEMISGLNMALTLIVTVVCFAFGLIFLVKNVIDKGGYGKDTARAAFTLIGMSIFFSAVGIVNLVMVVAIAFAVYFFVWRLLILNIVAVFKGRPEGGGGPSTS